MRVGCLYFLKGITVHCRHCCDTPAWRAQIGMPTACPHGVTAELIPVPPLGPGGELKRALARWGIKPSPQCKCNAKAREMDANGPQWCREHEDEILAVMREEAARRALPFVDAVGRHFIRRAVNRAARSLARSLRSG